MRKYPVRLLALCLLCVFVAGCSEQRGRFAAGGIPPVTQAPTRAAVPDFVDLAALSDELAYDAVSIIMAYPDDYVGKTVKISGFYQPHYFEAAGTLHHYAAVPDDEACCSLYLEFEWTGGRTPEDYPQEGVRIELIGTYGSYERLGQAAYRLTVDEIMVSE